MYFVLSSENYGESGGDIKFIHVKHEVEKWGLIVRDLLV